MCLYPNAQRNEERVRSGNVIGSDCGALGMFKTPEQIIEENCIFDRILFSEQYGSEIKRFQVLTYDLV